MKDMVLRSIVRPLVERLGTMAAAYLIARGLDSDLTAQLMNGAVALVFVLFDLVVSTVNRDRDITRFFDQAAKSGQFVRVPAREDD